MSPAEVDAGLRSIVTEMAAIVKDPLAREARLVAGAVAVLAIIAGEQEQRLRAMEPCPRGHGPHAWTGFQGEPGARCGYCEVPRGNAP